MDKEMKSNVTELNSETRGNKVKPTMKARIEAFKQAHPVLTKVIIGSGSAMVLAAGYGIVRAITRRPTEFTIDQTICIEEPLDEEAESNEG